MTFGERLTNLRLGSKYSTRKLLAEQLGIPETTLRNYEKDDREPGHTFLIQISEMFDVSIDWLLGISEEKARKADYQLTRKEYSFIEQYRSLDTYGREMIDFTLTHETKRVNDMQAMQNEISALHEEKQNRRVYAYYGKIAAAGTSVPWDGLFNEPIECEECERGADFTIGVSGDSMEPTFYDGDIVFVKKVEHISEGEVGIFQKDNAIYIKEVGDGCLVSHNAKYAPISGEDVLCLGKVVGKVK